jgi:uncharacterized protein YkwD
MRKIGIAAALAITALFVGGTSAAQACRGGDRVPSPQSIQEARRAMVCVINHHRARNDRRPVHGVNTLGNAAQGHSEAMVAQDFFSHEGDGTPASRAAAAGYMGGGRFIVGENLGWGTGRLGTPRAIVHAWLSSPSHRAVILSRRFRQVGVGVALGSPMGADGPNMATYTVDLGRRGAR